MKFSVYSIFLCCVFLFFAANAQSQITAMPFFEAHCGYWEDGQVDEDGNAITPLLHVVRIPMAVPGPVDPNDPPTFGSAYAYAGDDGRIHACGSRYKYAVVNVAENWSVDWPITGTNDTKTFTQVDNKAFWDWYYRGYNAPAQCDYSQNCHGFAFSVGDWPGDAAGIMNYTDPDEFQPQGAPVLVPCYEVCERKDAEIASDVSGHSIQVIGAECELPEDSPIECVNAPDPNGPGEPEVPCKVQVIAFSAEQFRESGTYTRATICPDNLDVGKGHDDSGAILANFGGFEEYELYRKVVAQGGS